MTQINLKHGIAFDDLYRRDGLARIDALFVAHLQASDVALYNRLMTARRAPESLDDKGESDLVVEVAPHLEDFIGDLFGIAPELRALQEQHHELAPIYAVKRLFVQRRAVKGMTAEAAAAIDGPLLGAELETRFGEPLIRAGLCPARRAMDGAGGRVRRRSRSRGALRRLGDAVAGGAEGASARRPLQGAASPRPWSISCRSRARSCTASPCCACRRSTTATAKALR